MEGCTVMKLGEAFDSPGSRIEGTVIFIDITNSTEMKEKESEAAWINSYARIYDCIQEQIKSDEGGHIVKYLGDGAMVFYDGEHTTQAINAAIRIQEYIADSNADKITKGFHCSIGISTGSMVKFHAKDLQDDYIGVVVDRAARLCSAASANAVFVDEETIDGANITKIRSRIGDALKRKAAEYRGEVYHLPLKGFPTPIGCYEILWGRDRLGIRTPIISLPDQNKGLVRQEESKRPPPPERDLEEYGSGSVKNWSEDERYAFIRGDDQVDYFTNPAVIIGRDLPDIGNRVFFLRRPPP